MSEDRVMPEDPAMDEDRTMLEDPAMGGQTADRRVADADRRDADAAAPVGDRRIADPAEAELLDGSESLAGRWRDIQVQFVDEPRRSLEEADALVDEVIGQLTSRLADERRRLESQWSAGGQPSTEDLRMALQRYRAFFDRLLAA